MDKYAVDYAVVERRPFGSGIDVGILFEGMGWPLVYLDGQDLVYVRPGSGNDRRTAGLRFLLVGARSTDTELFALASSKPGEMLREIGRIRPDSLLSWTDFNRLGAASFAAGDKALAEEFYRRGMEMHPRVPELAINLAWLYLRTGRNKEAGRIFRAAADRWRGTAIEAKAQKGLDAATGGSDATR
jgi:hypothetical protein